MRRRTFLWRAGFLAAGAALLPRRLAARDTVRLVILHTNDTHSRMDPFPDGGELGGLGGAARRAALVERIRREEEHVLLVDSGDIFQGTPYFNLFGGEVEFRAMSAMGYDVATLGNHDFDNRTEGLVEMLPHAEFDFVSTNYSISNRKLGDRVRPYVIREFDGVRVGVFGLGIAFQGLVTPSYHRGVEYVDPIPSARRAVRELRAEGCALIICLSHLGYRFGGDRVSDTVIAQRVPGIDLILGGHTHTFMDAPDVHEHPDHGISLVNQVGWGGVRLGRIDVALRADSGVGAWSGSVYPIDRSLDTP
jgi:5'-nucleotidase